MLVYFTLLLPSFACILQSDSLSSKEIDVEKSMGVTAVGTDLYLIQEESCDYFKVDSTGSTDELSGDCDYEDLTAIFQHPDLALQTDSNPILIACRKNGKRCVQLGTNVKYTVQDGGDGCHDSVNWVTADVEGIIGMQNNGSSYMVALIGSSLITYKFNGLLIESVGCTNVPTSFDDFGGISQLGNTTIVVSKTSNALWIGEANNDIPYNLTNGQEFAIGGAYERISGIVLQSTNSSTGNVQGVFSGDHGDIETALFKFDLACTSPDFYASPFSSCGFEDQYLTTKESCAQAAISLGLYDTSVTSISNSDRVKGCYYKESASGSNSKLYFNEDITGPTAVDDTDRSSICAVAHTETTSEVSTSEESTIFETTEMEATPFETTEEVISQTTSEVSTTQESTISQTTQMETTPFETTQEVTSSETTETEATLLGTTEEGTSETTSQALTTQESTISETTETETTPLETTEEVTLEATSAILTTTEISTTSETTEESTDSETMEPSAPGFSLSSVGRCRLLSQLVITEHHCAQGAIELGLSDVTVQTIQKDDRPYGCYFKEDAKDGQLWLNIESETLNFDSDESRQSLCFGDGAVESFASKLSMFSILLVQVSIFLFIL